MEVVAGDLPSRPDLPFQRRNVVEWSHRDHLTGALERARRETNHWSASTASAIHNYNKVVDQRAVNLADGGLHTQRKQLEVFSTQVPGGSLQVFRSSTTSSSRSSIFSQMGSGTWSTIPDVDTGFGDLKLSLHPLDLSSEKSKASVGRAIGWRRPPSRSARAAAAQQAQQAQQAREKRVEITVEEDDPKDGDEANGPIISFPSDDDSSERAASTAAETIVTAASVLSAHSANSHSTRSSSSLVESRRSCSSENLVKIVDADGPAAEGGAAGSLLGRSSALRRSLQYTKYTRPPDFPSGTSVRRMREEIEARGGPATAPAPSPTPPPTAQPSATLAPKEQALDSVLDKVRRLVGDSIASQNHSFVTVKSLAEVRGRLRSKGEAKEAASREAVDEVAVKDAATEAVTETLLSEDHVLRRTKDHVKESASAAAVPRVQSYVFGMSAAPQPPPSIVLNGSNGVAGEEDAADHGERKVIVNGVGRVSPRSEEWFKRRKSYGFEPDLPPQNQELISLKESKEDSWSDTGHSALTLSVSPLLKHLDAIKRSKTAAGRTPRPASLYDGLGDADGDAPQRELNGVHREALRTTTTARVATRSASDMDRRRDMLRQRAERDIARGQGLGLAAPTRGVTEPVSVSIPVVANDAIVVQAATAPLLMNGCHYSDDELSAPSAAKQQAEPKRHSIAVVEEAEAHAESQQPETGEAYLPDSAEDPVSQARKQKKVEFSKTEVHFAAEPGRFNLVSTDDKPPPTHIVRGRRRKLLAEQRFGLARSASGLPEVRFGDSPLDGSTAVAPAAPAVITVTMEGKLSPDHPPSLAGGLARPAETTRCSATSAGSADPAEPAVPMWRSTVVLKSNSFANATSLNETKTDGQAEFQRLLKSLRPTGKREMAADAEPEVTVTTSSSPPVRTKGFSTTVNLGPPETNGATSHTGVFLSRHSLASEQSRSGTQSFRLSLPGRPGAGLELESTPLVLVANRARPRRTRSARLGARLGRPRTPPSDDDDLSDESLQADAEVRAYMVEKSRRRMAGPVGPAALAHLDVSPPYSPDPDDVGRDGSSPSPQPAQLAQHAQPAERRAYRHHASKAERLVGLGLGLSHLDQPPKPRPASPASPGSVYVVPEQRKIGLSAPSAPAGPADLRVPSPVQLPKSFSLVDSVARLERLERRAETKEAKERPVSVREILGRLDKAEPKADAPRETIIEIAKLDGDSRRDFSRIHTTLDSERTNGPITDSVIFRDYRPASPGDFSSSRLVTSRRSQVEPSRSPTPDARLDTRLNARSPVPDARIESRIHARSPVPDGRIESRIHAKSPAPEARIDSRIHTRSPVPDARIESRIHARSPVPDARQDKRFETRLDARLDALVDLDQRSRPRRGSPVAVSARSPSAEAKARDSREYLHSRAQPGGHHIDVVEKFLRSERSHADERRQRVERHRRSRSREADAEAADEDRRRRRSQGREEASRERSREARRSRSRDELEALEAVDRSLPSRSRSRSQDELELGRGRRHRADGDLGDRSHRDAAGHGEARRRSRSRDALEDMNHNGEARQRSRSRDALEDVNHHHDVRQRSRSRDILDRISPEHHRQRHSRQESSLGRGGRSREELDHPVVVEDPRPAENGTGGAERRPRTADRKRPEVSKERPPEAAERRHRCKCAERSTQGDAKQGRPADKGSRTHVHVHSGEKGSRGHEAPSHCLRRSRAPAITDKADKTDKLVRKTRTHVAALASPLVQLVKPARRQNEVRRSGDIHLVMEPIRPVRRPAAPAKQSNPPAPAAPIATRGSSKLLACKRLSGTISDSNSSLSQGKPAAATERPARRNHKRQPTTDA